MKKYIALVLTLALMLCTACNSGVIENAPPIDKTTNGGTDWTPEENEITEKQTEAVTTVTTTVTTAKPEPEHVAKIAVGTGRKMCAVGNAIYYADGGELCKSVGDGSKTLAKNVSDDNYYVAGDWIYYFDYTPDKYGIYKMRTDGSEKMLVVDDKLSSKLYVKDDWIYYRISNYDRYYRNNTYSKIMKIKTDGTNKTVISDIGYNDCFDLYFAEDCLFYGAKETTDGNDIYCLYKIDFDGNEMGKIETEHLNRVGGIVIVDDWLYYYANYYNNDYNDFGIHRVRTDGTGFEKIIDPNGMVAGGYYIYDDYIYYSTYTDDYFGRRNIEDVGIYKIPVSGGEPVKLTNGRDGIFCIVDDWIYYRYHKPEDTNRVIDYKIRIDGTEKTETKFF